MVSRVAAVGRAAPALFRWATWRTPAWRPARLRRRWNRSQRRIYRAALRPAPGAGPGVPVGCPVVGAVRASEPLLESDVDPDPLVQFGRWFDDAAAVVPNPEAMAVAPVGADGRPSVRMVLLKSWGEDGFVFHTNYNSRKGRELADNPQAALLFYWEPRGRQVRIEGTVERTGAEESDAYFATRPRGAQIGARASHQSEVVASRSVLDAGSGSRGRVRRPGGAPAPVVGRAAGAATRLRVLAEPRDRLHDRLRYKPAGGWAITGCSPDRGRPLARPPDARRTPPPARPRRPPDPAARPAGGWIAPSMFLA